MEGSSNSYSLRRSPEKSARGKALATGKNLSESRAPPAPRRNRPSATPGRQLTGRQSMPPPRTPASGDNELLEQEDEDIDSSQSEDNTGIGSQQAPSHPKPPRQETEEDISTNSDISQDEAIPPTQSSTAPRRKARRRSITPDNVDATFNIESRFLIGKILLVTNTKSVEEFDIEDQEEFAKEAITGYLPAHRWVKPLRRPLATVSANSHKDPAMITINGQRDINLIQQEVQTLRRQRKKGVRVVILYDYIECQKEGHAAPEDNSQGERRQGEQPTPTPGPTSRKRARTTETATQRQRRQQEVDEVLAAATNDTIPQLTRNFQCNDKTCTNHGFTCFPLRKMGHLTVTTPDLVSWNEQIRTGKADIKSPPSEVLANMIHRRQVKKAKGTKQEATSAQSANQTIQHFHIGGGFGGGVSGYRHESPPRSSPPSFEGPELRNMQDYLDWLGEKGHLSYTVSSLAKSALTRDGWGFQTLRSISAEDWKEMDVPKGAVRMITSKQKLFISEMTAKAIRESAKRSPVSVNSQNSGRSSGGSGGVGGVDG